MQEGEDSCANLIKNEFHFCFVMKLLIPTIIYPFYCVHPTQKSFTAARVLRRPTLIWRIKGNNAEVMSHVRSDHWRPWLASSAPALSASVLYGSRTIMNLISSRVDIRSGEATDHRRYSYVDQGNSKSYASVICDFGRKTDYVVPN